MQDYHMNKDVSMLQTCLVIVNGNFKLYTCICNGIQFANTSSFHLLTVHEVS